ncbi:MAG TPA: Mur ligase domain-containing protein, partial [Novosphingobium sp.]|nr:Mur ligase domain-containing protein [Novosphingobium sp.]
MSARRKARPVVRDWPAELADARPLALWTAATIAEATGGRVGGGDFTIGNVATDSREITDGGLFFALRGAAMDGHRFVPTAFDHGAAAAIVEQPIDQPHVL